LERVNCALRFQIHAKTLGRPKRGSFTIQPEIIESRGLRPGDELALIESAEGLLVYQSSVDEKTLAWSNRVDAKDRALAEAESRQSESLTEEEYKTIWNAEADSIDAESEGDEIELSV